MSIETAIVLPRTSNPVKVFRLDCAGWVWECDHCPVCRESGGGFPTAADAADDARVHFHRKHPNLGALLMESLSRWEIQP